MGFGRYTITRRFCEQGLTLVHQIPYNATLPAECPVETMVESRRWLKMLEIATHSVTLRHQWWRRVNLTLFSYTMKTKLTWMSVCVFQLRPKTQEYRSLLLIYDNIRYYIAECTGNNWATGWRVGECSGSLRQASCKVIPLEAWRMGSWPSVCKLQCLTTLSNLLNSVFELHHRRKHHHIVWTTFTRDDRQVDNNLFQNGRFSIGCFGCRKDRFKREVFLTAGVQGKLEFSISGQSWPGDNGYAGQTANSGINRNVWILCSYYHSGSSHSLLATSREFNVASELELPKV